MRVCCAGCALLVLLVVLAAASIWLFHGAVFTAMASALVEDDGPQKADAIVVMGGDDWGDRIVKAAQLAEEGFAPYVIVSGPPALLGPESDMTIEYARREGYPISLFHALPNNCHATREETLFIGRYLKHEGIHKILLVTSNYHTRRSAKLMRENVPSVWTVVVAAPDPYFTVNGWWKNREGEKTFLYEWMKSVASWFGI